MKTERTPATVVAESKSRWHRVQASLPLREKVRIAGPATPGQLINATASGQRAMKELLDAHLRRVEWDAQKNPYRLHPFLATEMLSTAMPVAIDAGIAFGRPVLVSHGISTIAIPEAVAKVQALALRVLAERLEHREGTEPRTARAKASTPSARTRSAYAA